MLYNVIVIHPFLNGNKRTAYALVEAFLEANGYELIIEAKEAFEFLLGVASGRLAETDVEIWVERHLAKSSGET